MVLVGVSAFGCDMSEVVDTPAGGASNSAGASSAGSSTGGSPSTAGSVSSAGSAAVAGSSQGGAGASAGQGAAAGPSGGAGASSGGAGMNHAGAAGAAAGSGGGSTIALPDPSAGCGKASPSTGSANSPLTVAGHQYYVRLPAPYDAAKPYRLLFVFNPTNNPISWGEQSAGFESNAAKDSAIRVYPAPASTSSGWGAGDVSFFRPLYDQIVTNFCVDKARVFATGESSGGDFSSILGCEQASVLRGVAPCATKQVGAYPLDVSKRMCTGQVSSIVIHGKNDNVVGPENGPKTRDFYADLNHCSEMTQPVAGYTDAMSNCVQFQGCDAPYPVYWCQHTDPNYSGTNHGWPKFAPNMIWSVFSAY